MAQKHEYTEAVGRRKKASARVRIVPGKSVSFMVNNKEAREYFPLEEHLKIATAPLKALGVSYVVSARVQGGGHQAQAEAVRHGLSRAISELTPESRKDLKLRGYLTRDPRAKERKKFGLKAARRAPQWSKR